MGNVKNRLCSPVAIRFYLIDLFELFSTDPPLQCLIGSRILFDQKLQKVNFIILHNQELLQTPFQKLSKQIWSNTWLAPSTKILSYGSL